MPGGRSHRRRDNDLMDEAKVYRSADPGCDCRLLQDFNLVLRTFGSEGRLRCRAASWRAGRWTSGWGT